MVKTVEAVIQDRRPKVFSVVQLDELGLGVLEVALDKRPPISMILGGVEPDTYVMSFYSQDRARIDLLNGVVVRTRGFQSDVLERAAIGPNPFVVGLHKVDSLRTFYWKVSLNTGARGMIGQSRYEQGMQSEVELMGRLIPVTEMIEYWAIPEISFSTKNQFFYDRNGVVVLSKQAVSSETPVFETQLSSYRTQ